MKKTALLLIALAACACGPSREKAKTSAILIKNVHVVDVINGTLLKDQQILVDSGRIQVIASQIQNAKGYKNVIDGQNSYAMPGLTEMHAHIPSPPTDERRIEETLYLYLAGGATTIRGMLGHPYHLELRQRVGQGAVPGPRIFTSSPSLNGNTVRSPEEAIEKVRQYAADGYDFLKIHPGIQRDVFDTLAATANEVGIPFAGHVPVDVGIRHALESGYATIDHVDGYLEGLVPESAGVRPEDNGFFGFNFTMLADTSRIGELMQLTRKHKVWVVPTQSLFERWFAPTDADSLLAQKEMKYMPKNTLETWKRVKNQYMDDPSWDAETWKSFNAIRLELIRRLSTEGYGLLLGSDAPQLFNVPGFSLQHEIAGMRRAGLSPVEILRMGTIYPARFFGQEATWGSLDEGKAADIVLLEKNPLKDSAFLGSQKGVMVRGVWYSKEDLEKRLQEIAVHAAEME